MGTDDKQARDDIAQLGASMFTRGLTFGRTGNISVRQGDTFLMTPTGDSLGSLDPNRLSTVDLNTQHVSGPKASKEAFLHAAMYRARPQAGAVVHTHSTHSVAVSCLDGIDPTNVLPPITAYYVMRIGRLPLLPYHAPGDPALGPVAENAAAHHSALLLANHGPIVAGANLAEAADALEELEETAKLFLLLRGSHLRPLTSEQVTDLHARYPQAGPTNAAPVTDDPTRS